MSLENGRQLGNVHKLLIKVLDKSGSHTEPYGMPDYTSEGKDKLHNY